MKIMNIINEYKDYTIEQIVSTIKLSPDFEYLQTEIIDNQRVSVKANFHVVKNSK